MIFINLTCKIAQWTCSSVRGSNVPSKPIRIKKMHSHLIKHINVHLCDIAICLYLRRDDVWAGLYSMGPGYGYWQGTCKTLDFTYWASGQTYSSGSACMYMSGIDLFWYFDNCTDLHYVVCQVVNGKFLVIQASGYANYDTGQGFGNFIWGILILVIRSPTSRNRVHPMWKD